MIKRGFIYSIVMAICLPVAAFAQTEIGFGSLKHDSNLPIELSADKLSVDQASGQSTFTGNVLIGQGEMRLSAGKVRVEYTVGTDGTKGKISRLHASDGVTLVNGSEAAEARQAVYTVDTATVVMTGDVILTQGLNALSSDKLTVNLRTGIGQMDGRVKSIIQTGTGAN